MNVLACQENVEIREKLNDNRLISSRTIKKKEKNSEIGIQVDLVICEDTGQEILAYNEFAYNESNTKPKIEDRFSHLVKKVNSLYT